MLGRDLVGLFGEDAEGDDEGGQGEDDDRVADEGPRDEPEEEDDVRDHEAEEDALDHAVVEEAARLVDGHVDVQDEVAEREGDEEEVDEGDEREERREDPKGAEDRECHHDLGPPTRTSGRPAREGPLLSLIHI